MKQLDRPAVLARIKDEGAIAIFRTTTAEQAVRAAEAAIAGGFRVVEITYGVPTAIDVVARLVREHGADILVGAGTVLTRAQVNEAVDAGAQFLVSPSVLPEMIAAGRERDIVTIPGAFTPTEIYTAWSLGADLVKLFPAVRSGPEYLRAIRGPLPDIPIIPTAGVNTANAAEWISAGAVALGAAGGVFDRTAIEKGDWDTVTRLAREFLAVVRRSRGSA
jgi:2-dehydro-3-deoxyphosphogluconate aldolase/(4S)-4-hydroxy-2-oxoglutarate aldolase